MLKSGGNSCISAAGNVRCMFCSDLSSLSDTYDVLADPPSDCDEDSAQQIAFEGSQQPFLPIYFLQLDKMRQYVSINCLVFDKVIDSNSSYICIWSDCLQQFTNRYHTLPCNTTYKKF